MSDRVEITLTYRGATQSGSIDPRVNEAGRAFWLAHLLRNLLYFVARNEEWT